MIWRCIIVGLLSINGAASAGQPSPDLPCSGLFAHAGAQQYSAVERMPQAATSELMRHLGGAGTTPADIAAVIAPRDADWQATDVVMMGQPLPARRFIMAVGTGNRILVWYESGGLVHAYHLAVLELSGADAYRLVSDVQGTLQQACDAAKAYGH